MSDNLTDRLNQILPRITSDKLLSGRGLGNEIAFYIFDYPPEEELRIRDHLRFLLDHLAKVKPELRVAHVNLFDFILDYLRGRNLLDRSFEKQQKNGNTALLKALAAPLHEEKLAGHFAETVRPTECDLVILSGVGNVYPMLRTHTLLNNLHPIMGSTPLVMFFPGRYDGQTLQLFGKLKDKNYYRAFQLVP